MSSFKSILALAAICAPAAGAAADTRQLEVTFNSGNVKIAGTVVAPVGEGPHAAMVMVGGSGPSDRSRLMEIAKGFAREGLAVLAYDKRGTGDSGGNWMTGSLYDLADDAAAGFRVLASQPSIDAERIGYWGISQGGWIVPIAAARTPAAFAIVVSGGGLAPRDVETGNYLSVVNRLDDSPQAQKEIQTLLEEYFAYLEGAGSRESLRQTLEQYRSRAWLAATGIENVIPGEANRENWAWVASFEPGPSIAAMKMPVLVLLGSSDLLTPAARTANAWHTALSPEQPGSKVMVVPDAGHGLRSGAHGGPLVPDFYFLHLEWLRGVGIM